MPTTVQEVYNQVVRTLPSTEQLRLATPILNEFVQQNPLVSDFSDTWTQQERIDLTNFSLQYLATLFSNNENRC